MNNIRYSSPCDFIDLIITTFDIRIDSKTWKHKKLDPYCSEAEIYELFDTFVYAPMKEELSVHMAEATRECFKKDFMPLFKALIPRGFIGLSQHQLHLAFASRCSVWSSYIFSTLLNLYDMSQVLEHITIPNEKSVSNALDWLDANDGSWKSYWNSINENSTRAEHSDKLRLAEWRRGTDIPSVAKINQIYNSHKSQSFNIPWEGIKTLLFISRALDTCRDKVLGEYYIAYLNFTFMVGDELKGGMLAAMNDQMNLHQQKFKENNLERLTNAKLLEDSTLNKLDEIFPNGEYKYLRVLKLAREAIMDDNLPLALNHFKDVLSVSLYRVGHLEDIIRKARSVAAMQKNPDLIFLRNIQNINALYGYDLPGDAEKTKASDKIETWQIKEWKKEFKDLFSDAPASKELKKILPVPIFCRGAITPDYRNVNREVLIKTTGKKAPQLIWFIGIGDFEVVKKLLEKGASVDKCEKSNGSPLLTAVQKLSEIFLIAKMLKSPSEEITAKKIIAEKIFWELAKYPHDKKTLNSPTEKKKLLPLHLAIELGRLDIVKKIVELGADLNAMATIPPRSSLYYCLSYITMQKDFRKYLKDFSIAPTTNEALDCLRRHNHELQGYDLNNQKNQVQKYNKQVQNFLAGEDIHDITNNEEENIIQELTNRLYTIQEQEIKTKEYIPILDFLLESGADVNQKHTLNGMEGYTILMFAIELNLVDVFKKLLQRGADINMQYKDPRTDKMVSCIEIAIFFKANNIIDIWPTPILI